MFEDVLVGDFTLGSVVTKAGGNETLIRISCPAILSWEGDVVVVVAEGISLRGKFSSLQIDKPDVDCGEYNIGFKIFCIDGEGDLGFSGKIRLPVEDIEYVRDRTKGMIWTET